MISWRDEALILSYARHGETAALLEVLTKKHGRHKGIVRGGGSRKQTPNLQAGHIVSIEFSARLEEHLGTFKMEPSISYVATLMADPTRLAGFQSLAALTRFSMEERDPHPRLYQATRDWLDSDDYAQAYLNWEVILLTESGFELELNQCAVSGTRDDLAYISPKTGRAVTKAAAGEWADKLLPYSQAFSSPNATRDEVLIGLSTTEFFLTHWLAKMIGKASLPEARNRFIRMLAKGETNGTGK